MEDSNIAVGNQQQTSSGMQQNYCICKRVNCGQLLSCTGHSCSCNNKFHPECFGMSEKEIKKAMTSST